MNKRPILYLQTDSRWKGLPYRVSGETSTIGSAGCGPSCAAMIIATMNDPKITPKDTCSWSVSHGYKALKQGTYYSYFRPQLAAYGIECHQLLNSRILNQPNHPIHEQVKQYLKQGYYVIALMGPGTWTKGGHFILLWDWDDKVRINDPASTRDTRMNGDPEVFKNEVRCYWLVDARKHNNSEEDDNMDLDGFKKLWAELRKELQDNDAGQYSADAREWAVSTGLIQGNGTINGEPNYMWEDILSRQQLITILYRFAKMLGRA